MRSARMSNGRCSTLCQWSFVPVFSCMPYMHSIERLAASLHACRTPLCTAVCRLPRTTPPPLLHPQAPRPTKVVGPSRSAPCSPQYCTRRLSQSSPIRSSPSRCCRCPWPCSAALLLQGSDRSRFPPRRGTARSRAGRRTARRPPRCARPRPVLHDCCDVKLSGMSHKGSHTEARTRLCWGRASQGREQRCL